MEPVDTQTERKRNVVQAIQQVAGRLGNTPTICRKCYIHPHISDAYLDGTLAESLKEKGSQATESGGTGLTPEEAAVLRLLRKLSAREAKENR